jgi:hypothetical protein
VAESTTRKRRTTPRVVEELPPPEPDAEAPARVVCNVAFCPLCMAVTASRGAAPEVIEHLINAAREFFLAARAVIDVRADDLDGHSTTDPTRLEKIEIG